MTVAPIKNAPICDSVGCGSGLVDAAAFVNAQRPNSRIVKKGQFHKVVSIDEIYDLLFCNMDSLNSASSVKPRISEHETESEFTKLGRIKRWSENTLLYQLVERHYPEFKETLSEQGKQLPTFVEREFEDFLRCGRLKNGFLRVVCGDCKHEKLVAFSCKRRSFCPSCGVRRMAACAALLVDNVLHSP